MRLIQLLSENFDPVYVKPRVLVRAARELLPVETSRLSSRAPQVPMERRGLQRRLGDRRRQQRPVLLDLRSPRSRRIGMGRRQSDNENRENGAARNGIDTYA